MQRKPTERQIRFITLLQEHVDEKFTGTTFLDASDYISRNVEAFELITQSDWVTVNGY